jgi:hypothetical protein
VEAPDGTRAVWTLPSVNEIAAATVGLPLESNT